MDKRTKYHKHIILPMLEKHLKEGYSFHSFAGPADIDPSTLQIWNSTYPDIRRLRNLYEKKRRGGTLSFMSDK